MGAIMAACRRRFSRGQNLPLLYAQPLIDILTLLWESPRPRVPEQQEDPPLCGATSAR